MGRCTCDIARPWRRHELAHAESACATNADAEAARLQLILQARKHQHLHLPPQTLCSPKHPQQMQRRPGHTSNPAVPAHLFLISAAMVMNACSTLVEFLAEVSKKGMPISSAKACHTHTHTHRRHTRQPVCALFTGQQPHCYMRLQSVQNNWCVCVCVCRAARPGAWGGASSQHQRAAPLPAPHLCCLVVHHSLGCQVTLVAHQQLVDVLIGVPVNLVQPLLHIVEAVLVCHIVHHLCVWQHTTHTHLRLLCLHTCAHTHQ